MTGLALFAAGFLIGGVTVLVVAALLLRSEE